MSDEKQKLDDLLGWFGRSFQNAPFSDEALTATAIARAEILGRFDALTAERDVARAEVDGLRAERDHHRQANEALRARVEDAEAKASALLAIAEEVYQRGDAASLNYYLGTTFCGRLRDAVEAARALIDAAREQAEEGGTEHG